MSVVPQPAVTPADDRPAGGRAALLVALALLAGILAVAARSEPTAADSRLGGRVELIDLIGAEQSRNTALAAQVEELSARVTGFQEAPAVGTAAIAEIQSQLDAAAVQAGMTGIVGPGVVVTLTDSPLRDAPSGDPNDLVVHEQDLQAVINALWAGGAEAISVMGERVLATTAIRCVGNTLLLHGRVYSPPYTIGAVGDPEALRTGLATDPAVALYTDAAAQLGLGYDVAVPEAIEIPAFAGTITRAVADPVPAELAGR